ncbi:MAG TPA: ABC transporter permease [Kofleriaceae bacterium]|nr:ABC transporter permease [Kofleriaceae bacterium]
MVPIRYNLRSMAVRKWTTTFTAIGIALVVFVFGAALMLSEGATRAMTSSGSPDNAIILRDGSDNELSSGLEATVVGLIRERPEVAAATAPAESVIGEVVIVVTADLRDGSGSTNVLIRGMPPSGFAFRNAHLVRGHLPTPGTNEAVIGEGIAGRFKNLGMGESFELRRNRPVKIVGVFSAGDSSYEAEVWTDVDVLRTSVGRGASVSSVRVKLGSPSKLASFKAAMESDKRSGVKVLGEREYYKKQSQAVSGFLKVMAGSFAFLFSLAAMVGAAITMNSAVANRSKEIGTLRALGFSRLSILFSFLLEAIMLALFGGLIGLVFVFVMAMFTFPIMNFQTFSEIIITFRATPHVVLSSLFVSALMGLLGGLFPAIRAARVSPVEAMRA